MAKPPPHVLDAFGAIGDAVPLAGGEGTSWLAGDVVLKPLQASSSGEEVEFEAWLVAHVNEDGFRLARPLRDGSGSLVVDGWTARRWLDGRHEERRWPEIIAVGERFHAAVAHVEKPALIERRSDPWAIGDRVAWGELPPDAVPDVEHLPRLLAALRPLDAPSQLVHGDLTGNVLFHETLPPAIIDLAPYWRPTAYASAVVVVDALLWEGADETLLDAVADIDDFPQYLLRALIMRAVVARLFGGDGASYAAPVELALRLAA